ncbi:MAG: hypothetical protein J6386_13050 [Candidatus Synoicihabitans palmerolidicus]|nr:hypothetical protein [Candidatus Synoicihabitans palmerolidicus]
MENIETMVARDAGTFGENSGHLTRDHQGEIEIGDLKMIGTVPAEPPAAP